MKHTISILLENESGALSRVAGLFSARGYNIESLIVAPTNDPSLSRMTLVTSGSEEIIDQVIKQLNKLIDVVKLMDLTDYSHISREMLLVKISVTREEQVRIKHLADIFKARILDVTSTAYTLELTGNSEKLNAFLAALSDTDIVEVVRSGAMGLARGDRSLTL